MTRALLLMFLAMSMIPTGDTAGKLLTAQGVSPIFVAWSRFLLGALMVLPFAMSGFRLFADWRIWLRGALLAAGISSIQTALKSAPLGDVFAAFFIGPIFSYILAGLLLKEPMGPARSAMIALGFCGVLLVTRPGADMDPGLIFAVLAGLFYGAFLTASRWLSGVASPAHLLLSQMAIGAFLLTPLAYSVIPQIDARTASLTLASAAFSMGGNGLLLLAYRTVPATTLAPLVYLQLPAAVALGWALFSDLPDGLTWAGIALILVAGITAARLK